MSDDEPVVGTPIVISESPTHVVLCLEISKATLRRHMRFLEQLCEVVARDDE